MNAETVRWICAGISVLSALTGLVLIARAHRR